MGPEGTINQCCPEPQIAYSEGMIKKAADPTFTIAPAENSIEKADLLTKIDSCIEDAQYNINRAIDRLASERAKIIILEKAKYEVVNGKIGEGATEILSETVLRF
jgi:hypothetical protein